MYEGLQKRRGGGTKLFFSVHILTRITEAEFESPGRNLPEVAIVALHCFKDTGLRDSVSVYLLLSIYKIKSRIQFIYNYIYVYNDRKEKTSQIWILTN